MILFYFFLERLDLDDFVSEIIDKKSLIGFIIVIFDDKSKISENFFILDVFDYLNVIKFFCFEKNDLFSFDDC